MLHNVCTQDDYPAHIEQKNHRNPQMQRQPTAIKSNQNSEMKQNKKIYLAEDWINLHEIANFLSSST